MQEHSKKAKAFITELKALCQKHQLQLTVSEYDHFQLWPMDGNKFIHPEHIEDRTQKERT